MTNYLEYLQKQIHSTVVATIDDEGNPVTCVIDMMLSDANGLYFLTAKGKAFYERLIKHPTISLTGFRGEDTMSSKSITVRGQVREVGSDLLDEIFKQNPYMAKIYPSRESQTALTVFQIYKGKGEFFDLSAKPIFRESFSFGGAEVSCNGYMVTNNCIGCEQCVAVCPQNCINTTNTPVEIQQANCLHCGKCAEVCPAKAIEKM